MHVVLATNEWRLARRATSVRASELAFLGISALFFVASATATVAWCERMSAMGGSAMIWMRMPGQTWLGTAASFVAMWVVMMVAMMLPSFATGLWRHRSLLQCAGQTGLVRMAAQVGAGYFFVWTVIGIAAFAIGVAVASMRPQLPAFVHAGQFVTILVLLVAGGLQFTRWKAHHLACCGNMSRVFHPLRTQAGGERRLGLRLGVHCGYSCLGFTAILLVMGVMDIRVMVAVATAITAERVAPHGERAARAIGVLVIVAAICLLTRSANSVFSAS